MKTDFLAGLGLEQDTIDKIMAENGKDINGLKAENEKLKSTLEASAAESKTQLETANSTITDLTAKMEEMQKSGADAEGLKAQLDEALQKAEAAKAEAEQVKAETAEKETARLYSEALTAYVQDKGLKFSSKYAEEGFLRDLKEQGLKLSDGVLLGADDFVKLQQEKNPETFAPDKPVPELDLTGKAGKLPGDPNRDPFVSGLFGKQR